LKKIQFLVRQQIWFEVLLPENEYIVPMLGPLCVSLDLLCPHSMNLEYNAWRLSVGML